MDSEEEDEIPDLVNTYGLHSLKLAILNSNIDMVEKLFTLQNIIIDDVDKIIRKPKLYPILEFLLENNYELCRHVRNIIMHNHNMIYSIRENITIELLNICIKYLSSNILLQKIFDYALYHNNLQVIDILAESGYDIAIAFHETNFYIGCGINFNTFIYVEKFGVDILAYMDNICMCFSDSNDINGFIFCLENGVSPDYVFQRIRYPITIEIINCLLNYNPDLNKLDLNTILYIMDGGKNTLALIHLIKHGLNVTNYLYKILSHCIYCPMDTIKYFIDLVSDIDILNKLLPKACKANNIECVKYLLESGVDIHYANDSILNFIRKCSIDYGNITWVSIAKFLIKNGAVANDITHTFCLYVSGIPVGGFDIELFTYFLDLGVDPNNKFDLDIRNDYVYDLGEYILDAVIYLNQIELFILCLKYGADPFINNHGPLKTAIENNQLEIIKILLDLGSIVDSQLKCYVFQSTIDLLDQYQIEHKLKKID